MSFEIITAVIFFSLEKRSRESVMEALAVTVRRVSSPIVSFCVYSFIFAKYSCGRMKHWGGSSSGKKVNPAFSMLFTSVIVFRGVKSFW